MRSLTPKEKAKELYEKMKLLTKYNSQPSVVHGMCKKLALVCVEDRIKLIKELQVSDLMKYDLVEYEIMTQREIEKL